jgi:hypothetical protein
MATKKTSSEKWTKAWWFEPPSGVLGYGDGRKPCKGVTHAVTVNPVLCVAGLHASIEPLSALSYLTGFKLWRVELGGVVVSDTEKSVATKRRYLWSVDAKDVILTFARRCALDVVKLWDAPDLVVRFLKTGDPALATDAANYAATYAASYAAMAASYATDAASVASNAAYAANYAARAASYAINAASYAAYAASYAASYAANAASYAAMAASYAAYAASYAADAASYATYAADKNKRLKGMINRAAKKAGALS